jgi:hypothetical protein
MNSANQSSNRRATKYTLPKARVPKGLRCRLESRPLTSPSSWSCKTLGHQTGIKLEAFDMALRAKGALDVRLTTEQISKFDRRSLPRPSKRPLLVV